MKKFIFLIPLLLSLQIAHASLFNDTLSLVLGIVNPTGMVSAATCTDSDGEDYYTNGFVTSSSGSAYDQCSSNYVYERVCANGYLQTRTLWCTYGCVNGACVAAPTPTPTPQPTPSPGQCSELNWTNVNWSDTKEIDWLTYRGNPLSWTTYSPPPQRTLRANTEGDRWLEAHPRQIIPPEYPVTCTPTPTPSPTPAPSFKPSPCQGYGDVNFDGFVSTADSDLIQNYLVGNVTLTTGQQKVSDVNADGMISISDALYIGQYANNQRTTFPVCTPAPLPTPTPSGGGGVGGGCYDTDGGKDIFVRGIAAGKNDTCISSKKILEYWCIDSNTSAEYYADCPSGYTCKDGACVANFTNLTIITPTPLPTPTIQTKIVITFKTDKTVYKLNEGVEIIGNIESIGKEIPSELQIRAHVRRPDGKTYTFDLTRNPQEAGACGASFGSDLRCYEKRYGTYNDTSLVGFYGISGSATGADNIEIKSTIFQVLSLSNVSKEITKTDLLAIASNLESLKSILVKIKETSLSLADFYASRGDVAHEQKFREVSEMFNIVATKIDATLNKLRSNLDNPLIADELRKDIKDSKTYMKTISKRIIERPSKT